MTKKMTSSLCYYGILLLYDVYIYSMLPWVCTVKDQRRRQYVVRTSVTNSATTL